MVNGTVPHLIPLLLPYKLQQEQPVIDTSIICYNRLHFPFFLPAFTVDADRKHQRGREDDQPEHAPNQAGIAFQDNQKNNCE